MIVPRTRRTAAKRGERTPRFAAKARRPGPVLLVQLVGILIGAFSMATAMVPLLHGDLESIVAAGPGGWVALGCSLAAPMALLPMMLIARTYPLVSGMVLIACSMVSFAPLVADGVQSFLLLRSASEQWNLDVLLYACCSPLPALIFGVLCWRARPRD